MRRAKSRSALTRTLACRGNTAWVCPSKMAGSCLAYLRQPHTSILKPRKCRKLKTEKGVLSQNRSSQKSDDMKGDKSKPCSPLPLSHSSHSPRLQVAGKVQGHVQGVQVQQVPRGVDAVAADAAQGAQTRPVQGEGQSLKSEGPPHPPRQFREKRPWLPLPSGLMGSTRDRKGMHPRRLGGTIHSYCGGLGRKGFANEAEGFATKATQGTVEKA